MDIEAVERSLGYTFTDKTWLAQALTHPSVDQRRSTNLSYERLEYLGDAVLELVVSRELFGRFPEADEGELTKLRSGIVSREHLFGICRELGWGEYMEMSPQLIQRGGRQMLSVLANTFESVIGAVMMDSNYNAARKVALRLLQKSIDEAQRFLAVNYKGALLEKLQSIDNSGPFYVVELVNPVQSGGPFRARAFWHDLEIGCAEGASKHKAEIAAAADALSRKLWEQEEGSGAQGEEEG